MADATGISWTDATYNPWRGCTKVSPGCAHCYMFRDQLRYGNDPEAIVRAAPATFNSPLKWKEPKLVFTCSWSDFFHEAADEWRGDAWDIIRRCPQHTFQILTKRPELVADRLPDDWGDGYPNVWLGVSIENARMTWRADVLREIPAALRFISAEPLLGSLYPPLEFCPDCAHAAGLHGAGGCSHDIDLRTGASPCGCSRVLAKRLDLTGIGWIIVGGESGSKADARPLHPEWAREIRDAVQLAADALDGGYGDRIALHFKQWGSWTPDEFGRDPEGVWLMPDGTRVSSFAADVYGVDLQGATRVRYAGPRPGDGGKFLDGTDWCEIPDRPDIGQLTLA